MSGLEPYGRISALELLLSPLSGAHVALLETLPVYGLGAVEVSPAGYARQPAVNWSTTSITGLPGVSSRCNDDILSFGPFFDDVVARGWAIYDALAGGNLLASGTFVDAGYGQAGDITIPAGDDIQFQVGDLCLSLSQDCPIIVEVSPNICPLPAMASFQKPTLEVISVPIGGLPIPLAGGTGPCVGSVGMSTGFDGSDFTAEFFYGGVLQGPIFPGPGPVPHTQWGFGFTQPVAPGTVVSVTVTKNSDPGCTFTQNFTVST